MNCAKCGFEVRDGQTFCPNCGAAMQPGVIISNTNPETGNTTSVSFGPNGIHTQMSSPVKNPKVALIIGLALLVVVGGVLGFGIWAATRGNSGETVSNGGISSNDGNKVTDNGGKTDNSQHALECSMADGDEASIRLKVTYVNNSATTAEYEFKLKEGTESEAAFAVALMILTFDQISGPGVKTSTETLTQLGIQTKKYNFERAKMNPEARDLVFGEDVPLTWEDAKSGKDELAAEGFVCSLQ